MAGPATHFFKFIPPGLKYDLSIPSSFLMNLNRDRCLEATLRRGRHEWSVDIDNGVFDDGWRRFVKENGVQEFDFIVFEHKGDMMFDFLVFDQSTCEREYPDISDEIDGEEPPTESDTIRTHRPKKLKKRKRNDYATQNQEKLQVKPDSTIKKRIISTFNNHPCFFSTLKPCSFKKSVLHLPLKFVIQNGLKMGEMIFRNDKGRSWKVQLNKKQEKRLYIGRGLKAFWVANGLKEGDYFKFELVANEKDKPPIVEFSVLKRESITSDKKAKVERMEDSDPCEVHGRPYFMGKLKSRSMQKSQLYLPMRFVRSNGLIDKKQMILKNAKNGRSWFVQIQNCKNKFSYLGRGWKDFRVANGLEKGDHFKFELVDNEEKPTVNFYLLEKSTETS